jgi:hypothetical protein
MDVTRLLLLIVVLVGAATCGYCMAVATRQQPTAPLISNGDGASYGRGDRPLPPFPPSPVFETGPVHHPQPSNLARSIRRCRSPRVSAMAPTTG